MKPCFNTFTAGDKALEDTLRYSGMYGFQAVEIAKSHLYKYLDNRSVGDLNSLLNNTKLVVSGLMDFHFKPFASESELAETLADFEEGCDMAARIGASMVVSCINPEQVPPEGLSEGEVFRQAASVAGRYGEIAEKHGLPVALEPLGFARFMSRPSDALRIAEESGLTHVGIMFDTFHNFRAGVSLSEIEAIPLDKLLVVHVNDAPDLPKDDLTDFHRVHCGLGDMPLVEIFRILRKKGYEGYLSVEIFNKAYWEDDLEKVVREAKEHLDKILALV